MTEYLLWLTGMCVVLTVAAWAADRVPDRWVDWVSTWIW